MPSTRLPRILRALQPLHISRLAFFQLLFLFLALAVLFQIGLRPWLDAREEAAERARLAEVVADFESETASLDPADYAPEPVPDLENAAHWALAGAAALVDDDGFGETLARFARDPESFDPTDPPSLAALERNPPTLSLLHRMAKLDRSDFGIDYEAGTDLRLPPLRQLYAAGALLGLEAVVAASNGRVEEALESLRSLDSLAGALAREAPRQTYVSAVYLERLFDRTLRAMAQEDELVSEDSAWSDLLRVADQPPHAGGLCPRVSRLLHFDAAIRIAAGPDPAVTKRIRMSWAGRWFGLRRDVPWSAWAKHALAGINEFSARCDELHPLRGTGILAGTRFGWQDPGDLSEPPTRSSSGWALGHLQPDLWGQTEVVRRQRHRRLLAIVALTLLDETRRRGVDVTAIIDLPDHVGPPTAKELASCVEIQTDPDGGRSLVSVRRDDCRFWIDDSMRWPLPRIQLGEASL